MAIFRNKQENKFAVIPNELLSDENLSWKAKGVLSYLLSLPTDWKIYTEEIAKHSTDGIDSLNSTINELINAGYIERDKIRGTKGRFGGYEYSVYQEVTVTDISKNGLSKNGVSKNGKSKATNTNSTKTNSTKTNHTKTEYIILPNDDNVCFKIYKDAYTKKFNKLHMKVSANNYILLQEWVNSLANAEVMVNEYREVVEEYFDNLPPSNNGNIVAFIKTSKRLFDVDIIESAI